MTRILILLASLLLVGNVYAQLGRCNDPICGAWQYSQPDNFWQVEITRSSNSKWEFESRITDLGNKLGWCFEVGQIESRFNRSGDTDYSGQMVWQGCGREAAYYPYRLSLETENRFSYFTQGPSRSAEGVAQRVEKAPRSTPTPDSDRQLLSTGTGFLVNKNFVATADHVLRMNDRGDVCNSVSIMYRHDEYQTTIADLDPANDIGLLKLSKPIPSTAKIRNDPDLRLGETAVNYGFPLSGELSTSAKITSGAVNSLAGYNNNSAFIQFDAASQFGNSGGPVLDVSGNVIGVVSAKLDDAENQLVNFATKSTILEGFLRANKVPFEKADLGEKLELPDIAEKAEAFTVLVGCWQ